MIIRALTEHNNHLRIHIRCKLILKTFLKAQTCNFIKKGLQYSCFLVKFAKFVRTPILKNICEQLLLSNAILMWPSLQYFVLIIHKVFNVLLKIPSEEPQASPDVENVKYVFLFLEMYFLLCRWHYHFGEFEKV